MGMTTKTTVELPDELVRKLKMLAAARGVKLKDVVRQALEDGLAIERNAPIQLPHPLKLRGGFRPTTEDIETAINEDRDE